MEFIRYTIITLAPLGPIYVGYTDRGIAYLTAGAASEPAFAAAVRERYGCGVWRDDSLRVRWQDLLEAWAAGEALEAPLDLSRVSPFDRQVLLLATRIPRGEVRTYQWLASGAGKPGASRAAGGAMRRNPIPLLVPCHRVVPSSGEVGNYSMGGPAVKRRLLELEGVDLARLRAV